MTKAKLTDNSNNTEKQHETQEVHLNVHGNTIFAKNLLDFIRS